MGESKVCNDGALQPGQVSLARSGRGAAVHRCLDPHDASAAPADRADESSIRPVDFSSHSARPRCKRYGSGGGVRQVLSLSLAAVARRASAAHRRQRALGPPATLAVMRISHNCRVGCVLLLPVTFVSWRRVRAGQLRAIERSAACRGLPPWHGGTNLDATRPGRAQTVSCRFGRPSFLAAAAGKYPLPRWSELLRSHNRVP